MREISSVEIAAVVGELRGLTGGRIDKLYELGPGRFRIAIRHGEGRANLACVLGRTLNLTSYMEKAEQPTGFAAACRKLVDGATIEAITQVNHDRIVDIAARRASGALHMIIEMFGGGNLVVTGADMRILLAYRTHDYRERSIRAGAAYKPPSGSPTWIGGSAGAEAGRLVADALASAKPGSKAMPALFAAFGIGTVYIEEALASAGIDARADPKTIDQDATNRLATLLRGMADLAEKNEPAIFRERGKAVDYALCRLSKYAGAEAQRFDTVSAMLDAFYSENPATGNAPDEKEAEIRASIKKQEELVVELGPRIESARAAGQAIFNNMALFNGIAEAARNDKHTSADELQRLFPQVRIKSVDLKEKTVTIEV